MNSQANWNVDMFSKQIEKPKLFALVSELCQDFQKYGGWRSEKKDATKQKPTSWENVLTWIQEFKSIAELFAGSSLYYGWDESRLDGHR